MAVSRLTLDHRVTPILEPARELCAVREAHPGGAGQPDGLGGEAAGSYEPRLVGAMVDPVREQPVPHWRDPPLQLHRHTATSRLQDKVNVVDVRKRARPHGVAEGAQHTGELGLELLCPHAPEPLGDTARPPPADRTPNSGTRDSLRVAPRTATRAGRCDHAITPCTTSFPTRLLRRPLTRSPVTPST